MNNLLKYKRLKFNSKKGFTLVELIVAVMILLIVISASVRGVSISYRSALLGAEKNDAQSLAQRNCDIIMSAIVSNVENKSFADLDTLDGMVYPDGSGFVDSPPKSYKTWIYNDIEISLPRVGGVSGGYDIAQYAEVKQVIGGEDKVKQQKTADENIDKVTGVPTRKYQYFTLSRTEKTIGTAKHQVYKVTTYVYYSNNAFVTCEGEVTVMPK